MPNWCNNSITIEGTPEEVTEALALIINSDGEVDFNIGSPEPVHEDKEVMYIGTMSTPAWYAWRLENWGTKWNTASVNQLMPDGSICFSTAWSPPKAWFTTLASKLKECNVKVNIKMEYGEPGIMYGGDITNDDDGGVISNGWEEDKVREWFGFSDDETDEDEGL